MCRLLRPFSHSGTSSTRIHEPIAEAYTPPPLRWTGVPERFSAVDLTAALETDVLAGGLTVRYGGHAHTGPNPPAHFG